MNVPTDYQSTSGPSPPKPNAKRPRSNASTPPGTGPNDSKKAKAAENEPQLPWPQKYAILRERHMWLYMNNQGVERENNKLTTQVMEGVMELEMIKEWMADQLEELDLWRKGIYIHPEHQVKTVPVSHENTATPVSLGAAEDAAGSSGPSAQNPPNSIGVQDSIDSNILRDLGIPSNLANDLECDEEFLNSVGAGSCGGGSGSVKAVNAMMPDTSVAGGVSVSKHVKLVGGVTSGVKNNSQNDGGVNGGMVSKVVASGVVGISQNAPNSRNHPNLSRGACLNSLINPLQAIPASGTNDFAQNGLSASNLTWGMYIPNTNHQGALIRQDSRRQVSMAVPASGHLAPLPVQTQSFRVPNPNNGNHLIGSYGQINVGFTPQAPPPVHTVPANLQQSRRVVANVVPATGVPAPPPVQTHCPLIPNTNNGGNVYGYYRQVIPDTAQAPPPERTVPDVRLQIASSNNGAAAAQIRRYQEQLAKDAENFFKTIGNTQNE